MADKYKNKYRITSARLHGYDYGSNAAYFITICTQNRECFFGDINNNEMQLNQLGHFARQFWLEIPNHFPFVELGNFVVMPNHTHGILIVKKSDSFTRRIAINRDSTDPTSQTNSKRGGITGDKNPMLHDNISRIIRWYKGRSTFEIRKIRADFAWQARFYDHIIRNSDSFNRISEYIKSNPQNWNVSNFDN
jgi:putative transposase